MNKPLPQDPLINKLVFPKVIGHRGACRYAPENTLASLLKAYELGVKWIEFDVALSKDQWPIIMHDELLDRTTNGSGPVAAATFEEIVKLDAGSWFSAKFAGEAVPTFKEYLLVAEQLDLGINVEIKPTPGKDFETAHRVIQTLQQYWSNPSYHLLISSFSVTSLAAARAFDERFYLGLLLERWLANWQDIVKQLNCVSVNASHTILSAKRVAEIKAMGCHVMAYTVDDPLLAKKLFSWGVDAVFSNVPDVIIAAVG